jgi:3'-5' exoribonuclease
MESKAVYLNEIRGAGDITFMAAVVDKEIRPKRNGGSYLALRLADRSAELDAKVWVSPEAVSQLFSTGDIVKVRGTVEHYNDKPQLIISRIRRCEPHGTTPLISIRCRAAIRERCSVNSRHLWP